MRKEEDLWNSSRNVVMWPLMRIAASLTLANAKPMVAPTTTKS